MSFLIRGMEMPTSCDDCLLNNGITCYAVPEYKEDGVVGRTDDRPNWCPLVPAADVEEVVHCADCVHAEESLVSGCVYCNEMERARIKEGFCSWGERKANDG